MDRSDPYQDAYNDRPIDIQRTCRNDSLNASIHQGGIEYRGDYRLDEDHGLGKNNCIPKPS
jgi:hypothetical protein